MPFRLEIKRTDATIYWVEHFKTKEDGDRWLAEEQTRPYWDKSFIPTFIELADPPPNPVDQTKLAAQLAAAVRLRAANVDGAATLADLRAILRDIVIAAGFR